MSHFSRKTITSLALVLVLVGGLLATLFVTKRNQDIRQRAATDTGTAIVALTPGTSLITPQASASAALQATMNLMAVDRIELTATISGAIPGDFSFQPATPSGLQLTTFTLEDPLNGAELFPGRRILHLVYTLANPTLPFIASGSATLGTFNFTAPDAGYITVVFDPVSSSIIQTQTNADIMAIPESFTYTFGIQPEPTATPSASPTIEPTLTPTPPPFGAAYISSFTILTKFKGVTTTTGTAASVRFNLGKMGTTTPLMATTVSMPVDTQGMYSSAFTVSPSNLLPATDTYWITLKGEKHLQRTFTNLTIPNGGFLDLSNKAQEPGDLPNQDGMIDTNDLNRALEILAKPTQDQNDLTAADVNYDGVVNAIDLGLILNTLSVKPDETIQ